MLATCALFLMPTLVLLGVLSVLDRGWQRSGFVWAGMVCGASIAPAFAWLFESAIDKLAEKVSSVSGRIFVEEVLAAAVVEELLLGLSVIGLWSRFDEVKASRRNLLTAAFAAAIGFTTTENAVAVWNADDHFSVGLDRLLTIPFGHASLQLVMGYFAASLLIDKKHLVQNGLLMFLLPICIHGWGDFADALFHYEANLNLESVRSKWWFSGWILALTAYVAGAISVLWLTRHEVRGQHST